MFFILCSYSVESSNQTDCFFCDQKSGTKIGRAFPVNNHEPIVGVESDIGQYGQESSFMVMSRF